jgi:HEAT repeat protein
LIAALADREWQVREQAAIALGQSDDARAAEQLQKALLDHEWQVREQAARSLGVEGQEQSVDLLIKSLRDRHEQVREAAAKSLGIIGDYRAAEALQKALQDRDQQVRKKVAEALERINQNQNDNDSSNDALGAQGPVEIGRMGNIRATVAEGLQALQSSSPETRADGACSLGRLGAVGSIPALINMLGDDAPIRSMKCWDGGNWSPALHTFKQSSPGEQAAIALASLGQPAVEPLIASLGNENSSIRRNAAWAIGEIRGGRGSKRTAAVEPLIGALNDGDPWVRAAAAFSLGEMRPRQSIESLVVALGDESWRVREMAVYALGEMRARSGLESLTGMLLRDENGNVRSKAAWALGEIKDSRALDALTVALNDQDQRVRATARHAISEIQD